MGKRGPAPTKTAVLSTRIRPDLRTKLEAAKKQSGYSLSWEIESRLRRTFIEDEKIAAVFGSRQNFALMRLIASVVESVEWPDNMPGRPIRADWRHDIYLRSQMKLAINAVLDSLPPPDGDYLSDLPKSAKVQGQTKAREIIERVRKADLALALTKGTMAQHKDSVLKADLGELINPKPRTVEAIGRAGGTGKARAVTPKSRKGRK